MKSSELHLLTSGWRLTQQTDRHHDGGLSMGCLVFLLGYASSGLAQVRCSVSFEQVQANISSSTIFFHRDVL